MNNLKREKVYFGSWSQRFQSMVVWAVARQHSTVEAYGRGNLFISWPVTSLGFFLPD
jgi:hypothetical protein